MRGRQSSHARALAHELLPPGDWKIESDRDGRPIVTDADGLAGPDLSISHSGRWVAAALAEHGRIGVDVEVPRPGRNALGIARAYLSEGERDAVAKDGEPALLAFWTMREAIAKLSGGGLPRALALDGAPLLDGRDAVCFGPGAPCPWVVAHRTHGGVHMAIAWSIPTPPPTTGAMLSTLLEAAFFPSDLRSQKNSRRIAPPLPWENMP